MNRIAEQGVTHCSWNVQRNAGFDVSWGRRRHLQPQRKTAIDLALHLQLGIINALQCHDLFFKLWEAAGRPILHGGLKNATVSHNYPNSIKRSIDQATYYCGIPTNTPNANACRFLTRELHACFNATSTSIGHVDARARNVF